MGRYKGKAVYTNLRTKLEASGEMNTFSSLYTDESATDITRGELCMTYLTRFCHLPFKRDDGDEVMKSSSTSNAYRVAGNGIFTNDIKEAVLMYTKSVAAAPYPASGEDDSEMLASAFANRSAAYFVQKKYTACLSDIEQALKFDYPDCLRYKLLERRAKCYLTMGRSDEARTSAQDAIDHIPAARHLSKDNMDKIVQSLRMLHVDNTTQQHHNSDVGQTIPEKSFGQHKTIPSASDCMEIKYSQEKGRHIVATRDIDPGDILIVEEPFACVLSPVHPSMYTHCSHCLRRCDAMVPCKVCDHAMYCSYECRASAWELYHNVECRLVPALLGLDIGQMTLLPLRMFLIACSRNDGLAGLYHLVKSLDGENDHEEIKGFDKNGQYNSTDYVQLHHLFRYVPKDPMLQVMHTVIAACIMNALDAYSDVYASKIMTKGSALPKEEVQRFVTGVLLKYSEIKCANGFNIFECTTNVKTAGYFLSSIIEDKVYGAAIYSTLSLMNHACTQNAVCIWNGNILTCIAEKPITKGEEISVSYGVHYDNNDISKRREILEKQYGFECKCEACVNDWPQEKKHILDPRKPSEWGFMCEKCHCTLAIRGKNGKCPTCGKAYNILNLLLMIRNMDHSLDKAVFLPGNDATPELAGYVKKVHQILPRYGNAFVHKCTNMLRFCIFLKGNIVME